MDVSKSVGGRLMKKSLYITRVEGTRLQNGTDPVRFSTPMIGKWKTKSAERRLRKDLMDPSIAVISVKPEWRKFVIDTADFFTFAKEVKD